MNKVIKWIAILAGGFMSLLAAAIILIPMFVDMEKFKPRIETEASRVLNRKVALNGEINLSLFPWIGVSISDFSVENTPAFSEKQLLAVDRFEVRVKAVPLLSREIRVDRVILLNPEIYIQKNESGRGNWEGIGPQKEKGTEEKPSSKKDGKLPIEKFGVEAFVVSNGLLVWIDDVKNQRKEISDMNLRIEDISFDQPVGVMLSFKADGNPMSLDGKIGPIGKTPGKSDISMNLTFIALDEIKAVVNGRVEKPADNPGINLTLDIKPFSARRVVKFPGGEFPVNTADPNALSHIAIAAEIKGTPETVNVKKGNIILDDSNIDFTFSGKDFAKPDITFDMAIDQIDLDRYLPPGSKKKAPPHPEREKPKRKPNYDPLRKLVLKGEIRTGRIKARGAVVDHMACKINAKNGVFRIDPFTAALYSGELNAAVTSDFHGDTPETTIRLDSKDVQIGPLLRDTMDKDIIEGTSTAFADISMKGDDGGAIRSSLNGKGEFVFTDGAIKGVNLTAMAQNVKTAFGLLGEKQEGNRTDFSELKAEFDIRNGLARASKIALISPLLRLTGDGDANLVDETLDFRLEPKFVASLKGKGDREKHKGVLMPIDVGGTFSDPKFTPDLETILKQLPKEGVGEFIEKQKEKLQKVLKGDGNEENSNDLKNAVDGLIESLPLGKE